jgi:hypothetical protein
MLGVGEAAPPVDFVLSSVEEPGFFPGNWESSDEDEEGVGSGGATGAVDENNGDKLSSGVFEKDVQEEGGGMRGSAVMWLQREKRTIITT